MKVVTLFVTFICLFLAHGVSSYGSTTIGDVVAETQPNGKMYCDSLICPEGTEQCHVTKKNDPNDFNIIVRHRRCLGQKRDVLKEETVKEPNKYHKNVNADIMAGLGNGRPMTPEEKKEFDAFMKQTEENIQSEIREAMNEADASLHQMEDEIRNSFDYY